MPRPMKTGLDYFPMETDFFTSKVAKGVRREKGAVGILTYVNLLCRIYRSGWFYRFYSMEELSMDIAEELTNAHVKATAAEVADAIRYFLRHGVLDEALFEAGIATGRAVQEQYVLCTYKAKRLLRMNEHRLVDVSEVLEQNGIRPESHANANGGGRGVPPSDGEILRLFEEQLLDDERAAREALLFRDYNAARRWSCLPDWRGAAMRWLNRTT